MELQHNFTTRPHFGKILHDAYRWKIAFTESAVIGSNLYWLVYPFINLTESTPVLKCDQKPSNFL